MIGKLKGKLVEVDRNIGLIETSGGVFYNVFLPTSLITKHSSLKTVVELYTYLQVRDDALILFGFETKQQHDFFLPRCHLTSIPIHHATQGTAARGPEGT